MKPPKSKQQIQNSKKDVWSQRFSVETADTMQLFHSSLPFDKILYLYDIAGSLAHSAMLCKAGIISNSVAKKIRLGLQGMQKDIEKGKLQISGPDDDIHMWVERQLTKRIGLAAASLHTARSRNDQSTTDMRLYLRASIDSQLERLQHFLKTLLSKAEADVQKIFPGYTHFQAAQPIRLGFYWMAYFFMFMRDSQRLLDMRHRVNCSPLGSGAFAGVNYNINRTLTQKALGFEAILPNAMDAVSDRDFILEFLSGLSITMMHLSRLSEDIIMYSSTSMQLFTINDAYATGSSIMPNKKNPDALELIRGKTGRVYGSMLSLFTVMKGLPLSYNRDMQEDKEGLFDATRQCASCLRLATEVIQTLKYNSKAAGKALEKGYVAATDVADYLVHKGMPFRKAHALSSNIVKALEKTQRSYADLSLAQWQEFSKLFSKDITEVISIENIIENKKSAGGTSLKSLRQQIKEGKKLLATLQKRRKKLLGS